MPPHPTNQSSSPSLFRLIRVKEELGQQIKALKLPGRELVRANATRWSSFYKSFQSILPLKEAIMNVISRDVLRDVKNRIFSEMQLEHVRM